MVLKAWTTFFTISGTRYFPISSGNRDPSYSGRKAHSKQQLIPEPLGIGHRVSVANGSGISLYPYIIYKYKKILQDKDKLTSNNISTVFFVSVALSAIIIPFY